MTDTPKDKDNVVDFAARSKSKSKDSGGEDGGGNGKNLYYAVQPVIAIDEGERLIRLKYMTESGYLDILGIMNQIQMHNRNRFRTITTLVSVSVILSILSIFLSLR